MLVPIKLRNCVITQKKISALMTQSCFFEDGGVRQRVADVDTERHRPRHPGPGPGTQLLAPDRHRPLQEAEAAAPTEDLPLALLHPYGGRTLIQVGRQCSRSFWFLHFGLETGGADVSRLRSCVLKLN